MQVADEIPTYKVLKRGFIGAVLVVGAFYIIVNAVFVSGTLQGYYRTKH